VHFILQLSCNFILTSDAVKKCFLHLANRCAQLSQSRCSILQWPGVEPLPQYYILNCVVNANELHHCATHILLPVLIYCDRSFPVK